MMILLILFLVLIYLLNELSKKVGLDKIIYQREFSVTNAEVEEEFEIIITVENSGFMPISYLQIIETIPENVAYKSDTNDFVAPSNGVHAITMYLLPKQRIRRKYTVICAERGRYIFRGVTILGGDFLGLELVEKTVDVTNDIVIYPKAVNINEMLETQGSIYGDTSIIRWIISDPILTIGIRDYTGREPIKQIHWPSTVRKNRLMVKEFDFTTDNRVVVLLNIETNRPFISGIHKEEIETCLSITRTVMEELEIANIPYGFVSNSYYDLGHGKNGYIDAGLGKTHFYKFLDLLGRADYHIWRVLEEIITPLQKGNGIETLIIITPSVLGEYIESINEVSRGINKTILISLNSMNVGSLNQSIQVLLEGGTNESSRGIKGD